MSAIIPNEHSILLLPARKQKTQTIKELKMRLELIIRSYYDVTLFFVFFFCSFSMLCAPFWLPCSRLGHTIRCLGALFFRLHWYYHHHYCNTRTKTVSKTVSKTVVIQFLFCYTAIFTTVCNDGGLALLFIGTPYAFDDFLSNTENLFFTCWKQEVYVCRWCC